MDDRRVARIEALLRTPGSRLILAGRVPSWAWAALERHAQVWTRVFSEERGMQASARMQRGRSAPWCMPTCRPSGPARSSRP
jgi:hypothetical protein